MNSRILVISDMHIPYEHPDTLKFLRAVKKKYKPTRVINVGDEVDGHAISFHDSDPDLLSPGDELKLAQQKLKAYFKLFPKMDLMESNHGSLVYRKGKAHGLPRHVFKSYGEILEAPKTWKWHSYLVIKLPNGQHCYICHHKGKAKVASMALGMSYICGHEHSEYSVQYWGNSLGLYFALTTGCSIDDKSLAYAYNKLTLKRPVIGHSIVINSIPRLLPMILNGKGRWNGEVP